MGSCASENLSLLSTLTHYSKSQIFVQKFDFDKTPTFSRVFHPNFFDQFFSWNQSCQQLKSPEPQHFHEFFTPKNRQFFSGNQSRIFGQKMKISKWFCNFVSPPQMEFIYNLIDSFKIFAVFLANWIALLGCSCWTNFENISIMPKTDKPKKRPK